MRPRAPAPVFGGSANPAREALVRNRRKSIPPFILGLGLSGACQSGTWASRQNLAARGKVLCAVVFLLERLLRVLI